MPRAGKEGSDTIESTYRRQDGYAGIGQDFVLVREAMRRLFHTGIFPGERTSGYPKTGDTGTTMMTAMSIPARFRRRAVDDEE